MGDIHISFANSRLTFCDVQSPVMTIASFFQFNALPASLRHLGTSDSDRDMFLSHTISSFGAKKRENLYINRVPVLDGENVLFLSTLSFMWMITKIDMAFL